MKKTSTILLVGFLLLSIRTFAQVGFPKSWEGSYSGKLNIYGVDSTKMKVNMSLEINRKTDSIYKWIITYDFKGKKDVRNYEIKIIDVKKGIYQIDEKNSILINGYYKMGSFTSFFKVQGSYIIAKYTLKKNKTIVFEIISGTSKNALVSGNMKQKEEEIPEVISYKVNGIQKAILIKQ